jgi:tRNA threonylcarbamoyladenosine biosynthesis protein TsaB
MWMTTLTNHSSSVEDLISSVFPRSIVKSAATARILIVETSGQAGKVAVAEGATLACERVLDETRRHARDLAPAVAELLTALSWKPVDVDCVIVSRGPGSYTGLRVGIMAAKMFAYATGATLVAVDTFAAIADQAGPDATVVDVLADAQQDRVYWQRYRRSGSGSTMAPISELAIRPFADWLAHWEEGVWVSGPGLQQQCTKLPAGCVTVAARDWHPHPASLLKLGLARLAKGEWDDPFALEPLYLRPSAAEEKMAGAIRMRER